MRRFHRRITLGVVAFQIILALVLLVEFWIVVFGNESQIAWEYIEFFEITELLLSIVALVISALVIRHLLSRNHQVEEQLRAASGAFHQLMNQRFDEWNLTEAESNVAMLSIKGFSIAEIADFRQTSEGTIKAQSNSLFKKACVSNRTQLLSLFIDELMSDGLV